MAQVRCYIPDKIAEKLRQKAEQAHLPISKYVANLIYREVGDKWPENYFDVIGAWEGEPLVRPDQGEPEQRLEL